MNRGGGYASDLQIRLVYESGVYCSLVPHSWREPGFHNDYTAGAEVLCDRPHCTPELWNVLYESYRAEETDDHVVLSSKIEISHVRLMKDYVRMFLSGNGKHSLVNVQSFDMIAAFGILDVVARSRCDVEQGITRASFVSPNYAIDLLGFFLVVLVRVDLIVVFDRLAIHETISSINDFLEYL